MRKHQYIRQPVKKSQKAQELVLHIESSLFPSVIFIPSVFRLLQLPCKNFMYFDYFHKFNTLYYLYVIHYTIDANIRPCILIDKIGE